ncbi:hypothetical protein [Planctomycetes bacterium Poly30]
MLLLTLRTASVLAMTAPLALPVVPAPYGAKDLARAARQRWEALADVTLTGDSYRDEKRLCLDLEEYFDGALPDGREAQKAAKLVSKIVEKDSPAGLIWRVEELRGRLLNRVDAKKAAEAFESAVAAYPNEAYTAPAKQSYFHHLVVDAVLARWSATGVDDAEAMLESIANFDPRFAAFLPDRLEERYLTSGLADRLLALYQRLGASLAPRLPDVAAQLSKKEIPDFRSVGGDPRKLYIVLGADRQVVDAPRDLVVVMPGGNGQATEFRYWVEKIATPLLDRYVFAILSAPTWSEEQAQNFVWVTSRFQKEYDAEFPVEEFAREVAADLRGTLALKIDDAFLFAWSSGGPAAYATLLSNDDTFRGAYVLASVFKANQLDLKHANGRRFWLEQGTSDAVTAIRYAREARETLEKKGAEVQLVEFDGGHGFAMPDAQDSLETALNWLSR